MFFTVHIISNLVQQNGYCYTDKEFKDSSNLTVVLNIFTSDIIIEVSFLTRRTHPAVNSASTGSPFYHNV